MTWPFGAAGVGVVVAAAVWEELLLLPPQPASSTTPTAEMQMMGRNLDIPPR
jgi:hypothetical protein